MKVCKYFFGRLISGLGNRGCFHNLSDELYLKIIFPAFTGYDLDLLNPTTFNQKLQWLKINNREPIFSKMVDKYEVRSYLRHLPIPDDLHLIPLLGGPWKNAEEIDFDSLPDAFVLKCTHDSGSIVICKDKRELDIHAAIRRLNKGLRRNLYYGGREWPYKDVEPSIIAEQYLEDESGQLVDYKFFCFNGDATFCQVIRDRKTKETIDFFDRDWNHMPFVGLNPKVSNSLQPIQRPSKYNRMIEIASQLSQGLPFARIDLYELCGKVYFGEITFFPADGLGVFKPSSWDKTLGDMIKLPI